MCCELLGQGGTQREAMLHALGAADALTGMPTWAVTFPAHPLLLQGLSPRLQDYVRGVRDTCPHRVVAMGMQGWYSVMAEPLVFNRQILVPSNPPVCFQPPSLRSATGRSWRYIRDVHQAVLLRGDAPADVQADVTSVMDVLPPPWRLLLGSPAPPPDCTASFPGVGGWDAVELVCQGAGPPSTTTDLLIALPMGRLEPVGDFPLPPLATLCAATWSPCLV
jgi:hypothetical protein